MYLEISQIWNSTNNSDNFVVVCNAIPNNIELRRRNNTYARVHYSLVQAVEQDKRGFLNIKNYFDYWDSLMKLIVSPNITQHDSYGIASEF